MIVYNDIISGDELISDSYEMKPLVHDGNEIPGVNTVQSKLVVKSLDAINTGGNPSAEEEDEGTDDAEEKVIDIKDPMTGFGYEGPIDMKASEFTTLYKGWCKKVKEKIEERGEKPKPFMQSAKAFMDFVKAEFKNLEVYNPKSFNTETFILAWWDDEANNLGAPKFIYFENAMIGEKC